jgi:hypothetical protein
MYGITIFEFNKKITEVLKLMTNSADAVFD